MRVLIACEYSGIVRRAFRARGHEAYSCDLLPADDGASEHFQGDARDLLGLGWDLLIAHPPCTYLSNAGVRWLYQDAKDPAAITGARRWEAMQQAAEFFAALWAAPVPRIAIENPIMHGHARSLLQGLGVPAYTQTIQPWQFGHGESKRTCLWLKGLPELQPTEIVDGRHGRVWRESPGKDRWKRRSTTYTGIAAAMADQWGRE